MFGRMNHRDMFQPPAISKRIFDTPPEILYHYTDQVGLLGILEKRAAWATHIRYLNDAQEFDHACGMIAQWVEDQRKAAAISDREAETLSAGVADAQNGSTFVFSLSENQNLLSQWRAYGGQAGGFAIGFRTGALLQNAKVELGKCLYGSEPRSLLSEWLALGSNEHRKYLARGTRPPEAGDPYGDFRQNFRAGVSRLAPFLKHEAFTDEHEWRAAVTREHPWTGAWTGENALVRPGPWSLRPYVPIPLTAGKGRDGWRDEIAEIWVGPSRDDVLSEAAVLATLRCHDVKGVEVRRSGHPYRV
jgi:hypothetical protein